MKRQAAKIIPVSEEKMVQPLKAIGQLQGGADSETRLKGNAEFGGEQNI